MRWASYDAQLSYPEGQPMALAGPTGHCTSLITFKPAAVRKISPQGIIISTFAGTEAASSTIYRQTAVLRRRHRSPILGFAFDFPRN